MGLGPYYEGVVIRRVVVQLSFPSASGAGNVALAMCENRATTAAEFNAGRSLIFGPGGTLPTVDAQFFALRGVINATEVLSVPVFVPVVGAARFLCMFCQATVLVNFLLSADVEVEREAEGRVLVSNDGGARGVGVRVLGLLESAAARERIDRSRRAGEGRDAAGGVDLGDVVAAGFA